MAGGGNIPQLGGYDYEFTSKVPEDLECLVCHLTMKDPVQIVGCGHRLCNICMESLLRRPPPTCPADRQPLSSEKIFPDAACQRRILDLTVTCPHAGCSWTGELRAVEKHQSECPFKEVTCPNSGCTEVLIMRDLHGHVEFECSWRKVNCEHCQESFIMNQKQKHFDVCQKLPVQCTNKCGLKDIPREKLDVHVRDECPATEVQCEYKNLGCEEMFPRSNAKSHMVTQVERHLNLALRGLEATQLQVNELVSFGKDQSQQIERLMTANKEQSQQIEQMMTKDKEQSVQIERLRSKVKEQSQQIERHEQIIRIHSPFEWKIPNFQDICKRALIEKQIRRSERFCLFKCGYSYLLKIEVEERLYSASSSREGQNTSFSTFVRGHYASLYIKLVPGVFDSLLPWPCEERVRVTLIDQDPCLDNRENISRVIDFGKGATFRYEPPTNDTYKFQYVFSLVEDTLKTRSYIKDDTIFIMVNNE